MSRTAIILLAACAVLFYQVLPVRAESQVVFHGRVLAADGQPLAGAEVYVFDSANVKRPADFISEKTGNDGTYRMILPPGRYWTMAAKRHGAARFGPLAPNDLTSGAPLEFVADPDREVATDFTLLALKEAALLNRKRNEDLVRITGRILDADGHPVAGAYAMGDSSARGSWPAYLSAWTEADGRYTLFLPKGKVFLGVSRTFPPGNDYHLGKAVEFANDAVGVDLTFEAEAAGSNSSGPSRKE